MCEMFDLCVFLQYTSSMMLSDPLQAENQNYTSFSHFCYPLSPSCLPSISPFSYAFLLAVGDYNLHYYHSANFKGDSGDGSVSDNRSSISGSYFLTTTTH